MTARQVLVAVAALAVSCTPDTVTAPAQPLVLGPSLQGSGTADSPLDVVGAGSAAANQIATSDGANQIVWRSDATLGGLTISDIGRVGIGTSAPGTRLDIASENADDVLQLRRYTNNAQAVKILFVKALGTIAAPLAISEGVRIFQLVPYGYDGTTYRKAGYVQFEADHGATAGVIPGRFKVQTTDQNGKILERFRVDSAGHWIAPVNALPAVSSCGAGPTIVGSDVAGTVTVGAGAAGCTITFAVPYGVSGDTPQCTVTSQAGVLFSYAVTSAGIVITNAGALGGTAVSYTCIGV
jgi:hypothetical protein